MGEVPPTEDQEGLAASLRNSPLAALASKVMSVLLCSVSSQNRASHLAPGTPVSRTWRQWCLMRYTVLP
jgi:hypothetical protein